jgi:hypothetical protein
MVDVDTVRSWQGRTMVDRDGDRIGEIDAIYVDDQTGEPEWALVNTGFFGTRSTFVPIAQATTRGDQVQVPYEKQRIKDAPNMDPDGHLSEQEEQELLAPLRPGVWRVCGRRDHRRHRHRPSHDLRGPGHRRPGRLRADHRRRHDPLRGGTAGRHPDP